MTTHLDPRIIELKEVERTEGVPLPMFPWQIIELEDAGYVVDLISGEILSANFTVATLPNAKAVSYLLS